MAGRPRRPPAPAQPVPDASDAPELIAPDPVAAAPSVVPQPVVPQPVAVGTEPDLLVVGRIGKPQGLRGEVTVEVRTDEPEARFADGAALLTEPTGRGPLTVGSTRYQNGRLVVAFPGVDDRSSAELLRGTLLLVDAATLPVPEDPDVFLDGQLVGLRAELADGRTVGTVHEVLHLPHGDVLVVRRDPVDAGSVPAARGSAAEVLVPFLTAMVPVVDVPGGRLVITPPEGLLELSEPSVDDDDDAAGQEPAPDRGGEPEGG